MVYYPNLNTSSVGGSVLSKIKSGMTIKNLLYLSGFILFIVVAFYVYKYFTSSTTSKKYKANSDPDASGSTSTAEIILFYDDWCPYCKTAKPVWDELKSEYQNKIVHGKTIILTEINCTNESADVEEMINKYNIQGYPTIKMLKDGQVIDFDAKPTKSNLEQFITSVV